jgi:hypothetical protein
MFGVLNSSLIIPLMFQKDREHFGRRRPFQNSSQTNYCPIVDPVSFRGSHIGD